VSRIDPITLGVVWGALQSIAVEIGTTVHRTAYSEQAREGQDFSVAVFDPTGRMVAQGPYSPGHMGAMSFAVRNALAVHPVETLRPGDAILLNDPLLGSGHLPDFFITQPAFHDGALIGFAVNILHHTDVGGQRPGSQGVEGIFDYFQEGLRIPPTKVWKEYQEQEGIVGIIGANTRTPDKVLGDLRAQRSALRVGELRLQELAARYGRATLLAAMDEIIARTEASMRAAIARIPDGLYRFEDFMDDCGPGTEPLRVAVAVTVDGSAMVIDYEGSSPQTASGMNSYINYTRSYSYAAVKCLTDPLGPMNEGALRPITVKAPEGSFLNPRPPAAAGRARSSATARSSRCWARSRPRCRTASRRPPRTWRIRPSAAGTARADAASSRTSSCCRGRARAPARTAARRCRGRSTPPTFRSRRRRPTSRSWSSASSSSAIPPAPEGSGAGAASAATCACSATRAS
jgi:N-methylhydantoinase B